MIKSFRHKGLESFFYTSDKKGIKPEHSSKLERILDRLNAANSLKDMNYPGSNFHGLGGERKEQYSVKVSGNWRVIFAFVDGDAFMVDYDDYH
jgi:proteic killer suppression protein